MVILNTGKKIVKDRDGYLMDSSWVKSPCCWGAETGLTLREGKETRRRVGFMPPRLQCHGKEGNQVACGLHAVSSSMPQMKDGKQGGMWAPCRLVFNASGKSGNEAVCELHTTSSSTLQKGVETRRRVDSTPPRLWCHGKEKRGGMWFPCHLVVDAARRGNNEAAWDSRDFAGF